MIALHQRLRAAITLFRWGQGSEVLWAGIPMEPPPPPCRGSGMRCRRRAVLPRPCAGAPQASPLRMCANGPDTVRNEYGACQGCCGSKGCPRSQVPVGLQMMGSLIEDSPERQFVFQNAKRELRISKQLLDKSQQTWVSTMATFAYPLCDIPSGCCSFTGPWTVTRSSLRMLRRVATFCRPLRPVLLLVSFPRSRSPVIGVLGLC